MIDVPYAVKRALKDGNRSKQYRFQVLNDDETVDFVIDNDTLVKESVKIDERMCSGDRLKFGLCEGSSLEFQYFNHPNIRGRRVKVFLDVSYDNEGTEAYYPLSMGYFDVDQCSTQFSTGIVKAVAYNKLRSQYLDNKANDSIIASVTGQQNGLPLNVILSNLLTGYAVDNADDVNQGRAYARNINSQTLFPLYCSSTIQYEETDENGNSTGYLLAVADYNAQFEYGNYFDTDRYVRVRVDCDGFVNKLLTPGVIFSEEMLDRYYRPVGSSNTPKKLRDLIEYYEQGVDSNAFDLTVTSAGQSFEINSEQKGEKSTDWKKVQRYVNQLVSAHIPLMYQRISSNVYPNPSSVSVLEALLRYNTWDEIRATMTDNLNSFAASGILGSDSNWGLICFSAETLFEAPQTDMNSIIFTEAEAEALPDVTLRELQSAVYETSALYGQLDRETDLFYGVELNSGSLTPSATLYPSESLYPNQGYGNNIFRPFPSEYQKLWTDSVGEQTFRYLIITYKAIEYDQQGNPTEVDKTLQRTVHEHGTTNYNCSDNWLFRNLVWTAEQVGAYADAMVEKMLNIRWFPFEMWSTGLPYVEVGDAIEIADKEGDTHISYVLQRQLNGIQNLQDTYINGQLDIF